ncbi:MAG: hypothetical protein GY866_08400 [Proteobacteria bacterium]|nr:hypothetical protein [Pseudomonadota bacterium]
MMEKTSETASSISLVFREPATLLTFGWIIWGILFSMALILLSIMTVRAVRKWGAVKIETAQAEPFSTVLRTYAKKRRRPKKPKTAWGKVEITGMDRQENVANMAVYILSEDYAWKNGSADIEDINGKRTKIAKHMKNKGLRKALEHSQGIICIGITSDENPSKDENDLARLRSNGLLAAISEIYPRITDISTLCLRQLKSPDKLSDKYEDCDRFVIFISVLDMQPEIDFEKALRNALSESINLPFDYNDYQQVEFGKENAIG